MINFLKDKNTEEHAQNTVSVVNNHLVISLTKTDNPTIWRMDLDDIGNSVFSIKKDKTKSKLVIKQNNEKEESVASFKDHEEATKLLNDISNSLLTPKKSHLLGNNNSSNSTKNETLEKKKWGVALILVFVIIGLYIYLMTLMPENLNSGVQTTQQNTGNNGTQGSTGQVIDADEFLKGL